MPTYGYRCKQCKYEFDEFQSISSDPLTECPKCNQKTLIRIICGGSGLIFKGNGFYLTDYKNINTSPPNDNGKTAQEEKKPQPEVKNSNPSESPAIKPAPEP